MHCDARVCAVESMRRPWGRKHAAPTVSMRGSVGFNLLKLQMMFCVDVLCKCGAILGYLTLCLSHCLTSAQRAPRESESKIVDLYPLQSGI
jgi:hypothetical protein